jgi:hypothetical protein
MRVRLVESLTICETHFHLLSDPHCGESSGRSGRIRVELTIC